MGESCQATLPLAIAGENWAQRVGDEEKAGCWGATISWMLRAIALFRAYCERQTEKILWYANQPVKAVDVNSSG
jgi:hypothetical protein